MQVLIISLLALNYFDEIEMLDLILIQNRKKK